MKIIKLNELKRLEKEISLLSHYSERENNLDVLTTIISTLNTL